MWFTGATQDTDVAKLESWAAACGPLVVSEESPEESPPSQKGGGARNRSVQVIMASGAAFVIFQSLKSAEKAASRAPPEGLKLDVGKGARGTSCANSGTCSCFACLSTARLCLSD